MLSIIIKASLTPLIPNIRFTSLRAFCSTKIILFRQDFQESGIGTYVAVGVVDIIEMLLL